MANSMIYQTYQSNADMMSPLRSVAKVVSPLLDGARAGATTWATRKLTAACEILKLTELTHVRRDFGIDAVKVDAREVGAKWLRIPRRFVRYCISKKILPLTNRE